MISLIDINKSVNEKIKGSLAGTNFSSVPIIAEDVTEPIVRPSIKVEFEKTTNGKFNSSCREKTLTIRVYFFAKDRVKYKLDNIEMQDILETAFLDGVTVREGFYIPVENVESEVTDSVLICSFDLYTLELLPYNETSETMEILDMNIGKGD